MNHPYKLIVKNAIDSGIVTLSGEKFLLGCTKCSHVRLLKTRESVRRALVSNRDCLSCSNSKKVKGVRFTDERKLIHSDAQKRRYLNPMESLKTSVCVSAAMKRPEVKKKHMDALFKSGYLGPRMDDGQMEILGKWNRLGFDFVPNFKLKGEDSLFYLDGYDKKNNVVFEYDSSYHKKLGQCAKDVARQGVIIRILNPKSFWRYDAVEKQFNCVYRNNNSVLNT